MTYTRVNWENRPSPNTPMNATNLNIMDKGIKDLEDSLATVATTGDYDDLIDTPNLATVATSGDYTDLSNKPTIPDELADLTDDATHRLVTDTEKSTWSGKQDKVSAKGSTTKPLYTSANGTFSECSTYAGGTAVTLNNSGKGGSTASFYAPTGGGTSGQVLKSNGTSAPGWVNASALDINTYSTSEKAVGTWTDGKTIYRKSFVGNYNNNATLVSNVSTLVNYHGTIELSGGARLLPYHEYWNNIALVATLSLASNTIKTNFTVSGTAQSNVPCKITLYYTKTS